MVCVAVRGDVGFTSSGLWCGVAGCLAARTEQLGQDQLGKQKGGTVPDLQLVAVVALVEHCVCHGGAVAIVSAAATIRISQLHYLVCCRS